MPAPGPGDLLGGCRIEETIGRGGMGVVYRARQDDLGRDVAIKVIAPERLDDPEARRRFLRELRATAAVEHPNVVPVHEAGLEDDCAYIVMRYVPGTDLRSLVRIEGPLEPERAGEIAARLGEALDAIHDAGYVHRDVKPANVLISRHGHVYLSDLGIAKEALAPDTTTGPDRWVGTVDFAAPEQIRGGPVDGRADVYALGGVLFFMLTGHVPFERETDEARMWAQLSEPPPVPSSLRAGLPVAIDAIVARALAKDPDERPASTGALGHAAQAALSGDPTAVAPPPSRPAPRRRRRAVAALAGVAGLAAAVAGGLALLGPDEPEERASTAPRPAGTPAPSGPSVGASTRGIGYRPRSIAVAGGAVWVLSFAARDLARLDPETLERAGPQPRIGKEAMSVAGRGRDLWVVIPRRGQVLRLDAASGRVEDRITPPQTPVDVELGDDGAVWVTARRPMNPYDPLRPHDLVLRYDRGGAERARISVPLEVADIAPARDGIWISVNRKPQMRRFDAGGALVRTAKIETPAIEASYGARAAWGSTATADAVARVPERGSAVTNAVAPTPGEIAVAGGHAFVAATTDHVVYVLDAETGAVEGEPLPAGRNPYAMASGAGHVYAAGKGDGSVTRIDP